MVRLPPPIWAAIYLVLAVVLDRLLGEPKLPGLPIVPLGAALVAIAWIPGLWAFILFLLEGTEVNPTSPVNRKLVTGGPYRLTRNPMYVTLIVLCAGIALWVGSWPFLMVPIAVFATANWVHIPFEEAKMRRQFGATYDEYVRRVRRWI